MSNLKSIMVGRDILIAPKMRRTKDSPPYQQHPKGFGQHALEPYPHAWLQARVLRIYLLGVQECN